MRSAYVSLAERDKDGKFMIEYASAEKSDPPWFNGFSDKSGRVIRYEGMYASLGGEEDIDLKASLSRGGADHDAE